MVSWQQAPPAQLSRSVEHGSEKEKALFDSLDLDKVLRIANALILQVVLKFKRPPPPLPSSSRLIQPTADRARALSFACVTTCMSLARPAGQERAESTQKDEARVQATVCFAVLRESARKRGNHRRFHVFLFPLFGRPPISAI